MSPHFAGWDERTLDLAIERSTVGLDASDAATLERLAQPGDLEDFEHTLAAIHLAGLVDVQAPSAEFLSRLEQAGRRHVAQSAPAPEPRPRALPRSPSRVLAWGGWLAAAALLVAFFMVRQEARPDATARRAALIADARDLVRSDWTATEDPAAAGAAGDVVWSSSRQEGYMHFHGLAANDPRVSQYQLWIFDPSRADWEAKPVDGGVFDVPAGGDVVVPIDPKLAVSRTALFAVTIEVPGGVVVSRRERLVLTASV